MKTQPHVHRNTVHVRPVLVMTVKLHCAFLAQLGVGRRYRNGLANGTGRSSQSFQLHPLLPTTITIQGFDHSSNITRRIACHCKIAKAATMAPSLLHPPSHLSPAAALQLSQQAPLVLQSSPATVSSSPLSFLSTSESPDLWLKYENLLLSCLRTGDEHAAHQCLDRLVARFGENNERVLALKGLVKEADATNPSQLETVLKEYESILAENGTNIVSLSLFGSACASDANERPARHKTSNRPPTVNGSDTGGGAVVDPAPRLLPHRPRGLVGTRRPIPDTGHVPTGRLCAGRGPLDGAQRVECRFS